MVCNRCYVHFTRDSTVRCRMSNFNFKCYVRLHFSKTLALMQIDFYFGSREALGVVCCAFYTLFVQNNAASTPHDLFCLMHIPLSIRAPIQTAMNNFDARELFLFSRLFCCAYRVSCVSDSYSCPVLFCVFSLLFSFLSN